MTPDPDTAKTSISGAGLPDARGPAPDATPNSPPPSNAGPNTAADPGPYRPSVQGEDWPGWAAKFLHVFAESGNVSLAARACGIDRTTPYALRQRDEGFAAVWQEAQDAAVDALEARARQLALEGNTTLLMFLLRAHRPERYRERVDVKLDLRHEAERVAERLGISPEEVLARAERLVRGER